MDHARGARRLGALGDGPGAGFLRPHREVGEQPQQVMARADDAIEPAILEAERGQELRAIRIRHLADLGLDGRRDDDRLRPLGLRHGEDGGAVRVAGGGGGFLDIADIEHGLGGHQLQPRSVDLLALRHRLPRRLAGFERGLQRLDQRHLRDRFLIAAARALGERDAALLQAVEIGEHQLRLDRLGITDGIDVPLDMRDVAILEAAQHMDDGVHFPDIGQELVAEPFALRRAAHQAGDVHEFQAGRDDLLALADLRQHIEARVGHADAADIRLDRAEGVVRGLRGSGLRQRVEQSGFADIRQAHDAAVETHVTLPV